MSAENSVFPFDKNKFVDTVHWICDHFSSTPEALGQVKLHKILYYADMLRYLETGKPLTGVEYLKQPFGPTARHLGKAISMLQEDRRISCTKRLYYGYRKTDFHSNKKPATNRLSEDEIKLLTIISEWASGISAKEIREFSHELPWELAETGQRIDYTSAILLLPQRTARPRDHNFAAEQMANVVKRGVHEPRPNCIC